MKIPPSKMSSQELARLIEESGLMEQRLFPRKVPSISPPIDSPPVDSPPVDSPPVDSPPAADSQRMDSSGSFSDLSSSSPKDSKSSF